MERILEYKVLPEDNGRPVRDILRLRLDLSSTLVKRLKHRENGILLNGRPVRTNQKAAGGDRLTVLLEDADACSQNVVPTPGELDILFEDQDLLVVDKPAGVPVQPSPGHYADSLGNILVWHYQQLGQSFTFRPVNRLDKGTSGVMAVAKNAYIHDALRRQMAQGLLKKEYLALAEGRLQPPDGVIDAPIARKPGSVLLREVRPEGAQAVTAYRTVAAGQTLSLVRLSPATGRTHQIRVHLAHLGHPLLGDFLYGTERPDLISRPALHACSLSLLHPITGEALCWEAPLPEDMARLSPQIEF